MRISYKCILVLIASAFVSFVLSSCSSTTPMPIATVSFKGISEINAGDTVKLSWNFSNAKTVKITNLNKVKYEGHDSVSVSPADDIQYEFLVTNPTDTLKLIWRVYVKHNGDMIKRGPGFSEGGWMQPSYIKSDYLNGVLEAKNASGVRKIRVMQKIYPYLDKNVLYMKALFMDEYGNYITGMKDIPMTISAINSCKGVSYSEPITNFRETKFNNDSTGVDFAILLDNSAVSQDHFPIFGMIRDFCKSLGANDRIEFVTYNQDYKRLISLINQRFAAKYIDTLNLPKAGGLSAIYKSSFTALGNLADHKIPENKQALVIISYTADNSSIIYDRNDVVKFAREKGIPVFVIGFGSAVDSYSLDLVSDYTGGKFYSLQEDTPDNLKKALSEIAYSLKGGYEFQITVNPSLTANCKSMLTEISLSALRGAIRDTIETSFEAERQEFNYQAIASFDQHSVSIDPSYSPNFQTLAKVLKDNPLKVVELIGNSSLEGTADLTETLALKRAQECRAKLIQMGVNPKQIRVRSDGSNKPIYYLQEGSNWMQYFNRRVEIKWLDPDLLPFEIILKQYSNEADALTNVNLWEERGFSAYFERYLQNNIPIYRVKIWRFKTYEDALATAKSLEKDYHLDYIIQ